MDPNEDHLFKAEGYTLMAAAFEVYNELKATRLRVGWMREQLKIVVLRHFFPTEQHGAAS